MRRGICTSIILLIVALAFAGAGDAPVSTTTTAQNEETQVSLMAGLNIKVMPAFYWGTLGFEAEYPVTQKISIGLNFAGNLGRADGKNANFKIKPEAYLEPGYNIDLVGKYYFKGEAPEGLYATLNFSYNTKLYFDGNTRPFTLHNRWKELAGLRVPNDLVKPKPFNSGLGIGYQLVIIPKHIIANMMLAAQGQIDNNNDFFISIYLVPSIGYVF